MDSHWGTPNHRKRKRRRGPDKPPLPAQLFFDGRLKGDVALLSEDIFSELFPAHAFTTDQNAASKLHYIVVTPVIPPSLFHLDTAPWTILAVKKASEQQHAKQITNSAIHVSTTSSSVQALINAIQKSSPNKPLSSFHNGVDVHVLDVTPVALESVVVSIDTSALTRLETAHQNYQSSGQLRRSSKASSTSIPDANASSFPTNGVSTSSDHDEKSKWDDTIRDALKASILVHGGDLLPLSLPPHPITHTPAPPAHIELCEPVSQGLVSRDTKVVVIDSSRAKRPATTIKSAVISNGVSEEDEDTSNEQFFSAAETPDKRSAGKTDLDTDEGETSNDDDTDMSDSEGDAIGLSLPMLPQYASGTLSAFSNATPGPGQMHMNGIASPGSVISAFSTSTIRGSTSKGRLFETQGLYAPIDNDLINPKPSAEEDEEARVFLDTASLVKIGCFSSDWVRMEAAPESSLGALASWGLRPNLTGDADQEWRVARVYALPGQPPSRPRYAIDRTGSRRSSMSLSQFDRSAPSPRVYMSPLLLSNLGDPPNVRISSLIPPQHHRSSARAPPPKIRPGTAQTPPTAKEVTFVKLLTPLATERNLDSGLFLGIRRFFETKQRVVKAGDIVAVPIDGDLGKAIYQASTGEEDTEQEELLSRYPQQEDNEKASGLNQVVWFKIAVVAVESGREDVDRDDEISWGGIALVKPGTTRMAQSGSERAKLPDVMHSSWPYYLGAKRLPAMAEATNIPYLQTPPKIRASQLRHRLRELTSVATSPRAIHLGLPPVAILLVSTQRHIGKSTIVSNACLDLGYHTFVIDANDIIVEGGGGGGDVKTAGLLEARAERGLTCGSEYTALLIKHVEALTSERMISALRQILSSSRVFVATTTDVETVPDAVRSLFTHEIEVNAPDEIERETLLQDIVSNIDIPLSADVDLSSVAIKTAALVAGDLVDVVDRALVARTARLEKLAVSSVPVSSRSATDSKATLRDIVLAGGNSVRCLTSADFTQAVDHARKNFADSIGAPKIPNVSWDDVGGLANVKDAVMETIQLPLERPELFAKGLKKRSGILFYGPPGTGKTLLAKAIATEFSLNFFSVKGPELLNMYIGESEANVRRVFQRARDARPCVVFFDELDSVAPKRGNQGDSGGVMDRIVSQLLAELDGMSGGEETGGGVFVIGATNRPDLLDQALLRPGRFDKMLYLGVSDTHDKQLTILEALTRKFTLHPALSLRSVSQTLPFTYTGADLYALCSDAMLKAITRRASSVDRKVKYINSQRATSTPALQPITVAHFFDHYATEDDTSVVVEEEDFASAQRELVPSVSAMELEHYERVRATFEQGGSGTGTSNGGSASVNGKGKGNLYSQNGSEALNGNGNDILQRIQGLRLASDPNLNDQSEEPITTSNGYFPPPTEPTHPASPTRTNTAGSSNSATNTIRRKEKGKGKAHAIGSNSKDFDAISDFGFGKATDEDEEGLLYSP